MREQSRRCNFAVPFPRQQTTWRQESCAKNAPREADQEAEDVPRLTKSRLVRNIDCSLVAAEGDLATANGQG